MHSVYVDLQVCTGGHAQQLAEVHVQIPLDLLLGHICLLLQRDELAPCIGEAKACYNTVQALSKIVLSEAWLTKSLYNEL